MKKDLSFGRFQQIIGSAWVWLIMIFAVASYLNPVSGQVTLASDNAANYGTTVNWTNGSNRGFGFGPWVINTEGNGARIIANPSAAGISGTNGAQYFGLVANPDDISNSVQANRSFEAGLPVGAIFSFKWGTNQPTGSANGSKGFILYSGTTKLLTINHGNSDALSIQQYTGTPGPFLSNNGTSAITITIERISATQLRVQSNGRDGNESYDGTFTFLPNEIPNGFGIYATALLDDNANRQPYFNDFVITDNTGYNITANGLQFKAIAFNISITGAKTLSGSLLQGSSEVIVTSLPGLGFQDEGVVFTGTVNFINGTGILSTSLFNPGNHRIKVAVEGIYPVILSPNLQVLDFSNFNITEPTAQVSGVEFNLGITGAVDTHNDPIHNQTRNIVITSNQVANGGLVFDGDVTFTNGAADIIISLLNQTTGTVEHIVSVTIDGITQAKVIGISVTQNSSSFTILGYFASKPSSTPIAGATINAGEQFYIKIGNLNGIDGNPFVSPISVVVTSDLQSEIRVESDIAVTDDNGDPNYYLLMNPTGDKTVFRSGDHNLEVYIPALGIRKKVTDTPNPASKLTVSPGSPSSLVVVQQPLAQITGSFDDAAVNIGTILLEARDAYGNMPSSAPGPFQSASAVLLDSLGNELNQNHLGGTKTVAFFNPPPADKLVFNDLNININGAFKITFSSADFSSDTTNLFKVSNVEDESGFTILNPGPRIPQPYELTLSQVRNNTGAFISGEEAILVDILEEFEGDFFSVPGEPYPMTVNLVNGQGTIIISDPDAEYFSFYDDGTEFIVFVEFEDRGISESISIPFYANDGSEFSASVSPTGTQIIGNPFTVNITGAKDIATDFLTDRDHLVTITSDIGDEVLFNDYVLFTGNGVASIPGLVLNVAETHELTVKIDWVLVPYIIEPKVVVADGVVIRNQAGTILSETSPHVFPAQQVGYSQLIVNSIQELIRIEKIGTSDVTSISITLPVDSDFNVVQPDPAAIVSPATHTNFTIFPKTGLSAGTYSETVTVNYIINSVSGFQTFNIEFTVNDRFEFTLEDNLSNDLGPGKDLNFGAGLVNNYSDISRTITITNTGTGPLENINITLGGLNPGSFTASTASILGPIAPASTTTFTLGPNNGLPIGNYSTIVTISSNGGAAVLEFIARFSVSSSGLSVSLQPSGPLFLGVFSAGYNPDNAEQLITVTNTGTLNLVSTTTIGLSGANASDFVLSTENPITSPANVAPGASFTFTVKPAPGIVNETYTTATITVTPNATDVEAEKAIITVGFQVDNMQWNGTVNNSWSLANNWAPTGGWPAGVSPSLPNRFVNIVIPESPTRNPVISQINVRTRWMEIRSGATLNVQNGRTLTIDNEATGSKLEILDGGNLTIAHDARLTAEATVTSSAPERLVVKSTAAGTGSVIVNNTGVQATVERWMKPGNHLHLLTTPVTGLTLGEFFFDNGLTVGNATVDSANIRVFNEDTHSWGSWGAFDENEVFTPGKSYILVSKGTATWNFRGELVQNTVTIPTIRQRFGWHSLGNPYPSAMNVNSFITNNFNELQSEFKALYVYDFAQPSASRFRPVNLVDGPRNLVNGQGFFVRVGELNSSGEPKNVVFNNPMRAHVTTTYFKDDPVEEEEINWQKLRLYLQRGTNVATTLVAFDPYVTTGLDKGYDAGLFVNDESFYIYTRLPGDTTRLSIQALPDNDFANMMVPVGLVNNAGGQITLRADVHELPPHLTPLLYDADKDIYTELTPTGFTTTLTAGAHHNRFHIRMQDNRISHTLTFTATTSGGSLVAERNGNLLVSGAQVSEGSQIVFSATPWSGYEVKDWMVNGSVVESATGNEFVMERILKDTHIAATFIPSGKEAIALGTGETADGNWLAWFAHGEIIIRGMMEENSSARVLDVTGRSILSTHLETELYNKINVKGLQEGVYFIQIDSNGRTETKRLYIR